MKTIREQFEEIWPVPDNIQWNASVCEYLPGAGLQASESTLEKCVEFDARLDTFTRCQESQAIVTSLNDELVEALQRLMDIDCPITWNPSQEQLVEFWEYEGTQGREETEDQLFALAVIAKVRGQK